jgi:hypothetical protein
MRDALRMLIGGCLMLLMMFVVSSSVAQQPALGDCQVGGTTTHGKTQDECNSLGGTWKVNAPPPSSSGGGEVAFLTFVASALAWGWLRRPRRG